MTPSDRLKVNAQASEPEAPLGPRPPGVLLVAVQAPVVRASVSVTDSEANGFK